MFTCENDRNLNDFKDSLYPKIDDQDVMNLYHSISFDESVHAFKTMKPNKVPSLNGYQVFFFKSIVILLGKMSINLLLMHLRKVNSVKS